MACWYDITCVHKYFGFGLDFFRVDLDCESHILWVPSSDFETTAAPPLAVTWRSGGGLVDIIDVVLSSTAPKSTGLYSIALPPRAYWVPLKYPSLSLHVLPNAGIVSAWMPSFHVTRLEKAISFNSSPISMKDGVYQLVSWCYKKICSFSCRNVYFYLVSRFDNSWHMKAFITLIITDLRWFRAFLSKRFPLIKLQ